MIDLPIVDRDEAARDSEEGRAQTRFWRSATHLKSSSSFKKTHGEEFMPGASEGPGGASRRQFLQLMGASMALAGLTACRRPVEKILPYTRQPEEVIPGVPREYATSMSFRGSMRGLVVEAHDGRPTKVEGNPDHPGTQGRTSHFEQASVLNLYDPDRSTEVLRDGGTATWDDFVGFARSLPASTRMAVLYEGSSSPTVDSIREQMDARFASVEWVDYDLVGDDPAMQAIQQATGQRLRPEYHFSEADTIVALDADFLSPTERNFVFNTRQYAQSRNFSDGEAPSRLYAVESGYSLTGGMADHRWRMKAARIPAFAAALAAELGVSVPGAASVRLTEEETEHVRVLADDLRSAGDGAIVLAGETQPPAVHAIAMAINEALGAVGTTVQYRNTGEEAREPLQERMVRLVREMRAGRVDVLLMVGANPAYGAPAQLGFEEALERVGAAIHVGMHRDETAELADWHLPRAHYLESWGDGRAYDGTLSVVQPVIRPLYEAVHSDIEILNLLATGEEASGYDLVRLAWQDQLSGSFEEEWRRVLHQGFLEDTAFATTSPSVSLSGITLPTADTEDLEVVFRLDPRVLDGSFGNNAWCMELPDPVTKITWDNVAMMSPATAEELGLSAEYSKGQYYVDIVELSLNGASTVMPVWVLPGHADGSITVTMGYDRDIVSNRGTRESPFWDVDDNTDIYGHGPLANGIGANVAKLRSGYDQHISTGVQVAKVESDYMIATTQDHGTLDISARPIYRLGTWDQFQKNEDFVDDMGPAPLTDEEWEEYPPLWAEDHPTTKDAYKDSSYYETQWGMSIDLNACTGCSACVVACQSENNIPVVGKEQVSRGREMHWMRIDRYWVSSEDEQAEPQMVTQPMPCQHCENAPCESVCPVAATVHSPDGTNQMIYNRCIGTRYCSNNCPYKVRRFNFFNWTKTLPLEVQMGQNPDVTVRSRGVMEKCSFCVQRIRQAQQTANLEDRSLRDQEVRTACQEACPADAIQFGNVADPTSQVSRLKDNPRNYEMLAYLNVKPRTSYLARVRNPNELIEPPVEMEAPASYDESASASHGEEHAS